MAFAKKMMGFPSDSVSFSTKLPSKRHEKIRVTFLVGIKFFLEKTRTKCLHPQNKKFKSVIAMKKYNSSLNSIFINSSDMKREVLMFLRNVSQETMENTFRLKTSYQLFLLMSENLL